MLFAKVARRIRGLDAFLKVILCIVLVVSLCPPLTGAFAGADEGEPVEPQATDTPLDASALEEGGLDVYADEDGVTDVDADADAGAAAPAAADQDAGSPDADMPSTVAEPDANADTAPAADDSDAPAPVAAGFDDLDATAKPQQGGAASNVSGQTLTFEDKTLVATVTAPAGTLPEGATLEVEEVLPTNDDNGEAYSEVMTSLGKEMLKRDATCTDARVYDVRIMNANGTEIEPNGKVSVRFEFKHAMEIGEKSDQIDIAHYVDNGSLTIVDADVDANKAGKLVSAEFETSSFSYYAIFSQSGSSSATAEPSVKVGDYGWIRFATTGLENTAENRADEDKAKNINWGYYANESAFPDLATDDGKQRIIQVKLWKKKATTEPYETERDNYLNNYEVFSTSQYHWTWDNQLVVNEFDFPGYEVVQTRMHTAWDSPEDDRWNDSLIDVYNIRGYKHGQYPNVPEGQPNADLNVLNVYLDDGNLPPDTSTKYIVRYVHADGSVSDGNVRYLQAGQTVDVSAASQKREGEVYSGMSIITGVDAMSDIKNGNGGVKISYNSKVDLAKVYIYYKDDPDANKTTESPSRYDKNEGEEYYVGSEGLYNNKKAIVGENNREFVLDLETWYVKRAASVGMVLDASGSMAWTAGEPQPIQLTSSQLNKITNLSNKKLNSAIPNPYRGTTVPRSFLSLSEVNDILITSKTENTSMGYNGYTYYVMDPRESTATTSGVSEYVALGYKSDTNRPQGNNASSTPPYGILPSGDYVRWPATDIDWYYVNSTSDTNTINNNTEERAVGKSYDAGSKDRKGGAQFFVDSNNILCCRFYEGGESRVSQVFEKRNQMFTKMETLQDSIAQFGSILLGSSPESEIAMTRFSTDNLSLDRLPLLNWTSDTSAVAAAMNQTSGATLKTKVDSYPAQGTDKPAFSTYQYGLTGQTKTYTGIQAYSKYIKNRASGDTHKYLIIFTDGKDTNKDADDVRDINGGNPPLSKLGDAGKQVQALVDDGYTIITVLMRSQAMAGNELNDSRAFLRGLASYGLDGNSDNKTLSNKLYFEADSNNSRDMVEAFHNIANQITAGLKGYTVRDYIDPRFDVINESGDVLSVLDEDTGTFTNGTDANGLRKFTTPDNKDAYLGYDASRKMFYVLWVDQEIESTSINSEKVNPWHSQVRVQAKEDFLGGNDILSNGNEPDLNSVYKPAASDPTGLTPDKSDPNKYPHKDFPLATTNPATLSVNLANYEDTVFLGEAVTPATLYAKVAKAAATVPDDDGTAWYFDYLNRAGTQIFGNVESLVTGLTKGTTLTASKTDARQSGFAVERQGDKITLTAPYYYLENGLGSYAGGAKHQSDRVGTLTYTWRKVVNNHTYTDAFEGFTTSNSTSPDNDIKYELTVKYEPLGLEDAASGDDGSARTNALTQPWDNSNDYKNGYTLTRDAVGTPAATQTTLEADGTSTTQGTAVVHVVDGRVQVVKEIPKDEYELLPASLTSFEFTLTNGSDSQTITIPKASLTLDGNVYKATSDWITHLPKGSWELQENTPRGYTASYTDGEYDGDDAEAATYSKSSPALGAEVQTSATKATIAIGTTPKSDGEVYPTADFAYATVVDASGAYKGVDRTSNTKAYLNAQIGQVVVKNSVVKAQFTIQKMLKEGNNEPVLATTGLMGTSQGITFSLFKAKNENNAWVKDGEAIATKVTDSESARATFGDLLPGTYLLEEVSGTPEGYSAGGPWIVTVADGQATLSGANATAVAGEAGVWKIVNEKAKIALRINKTATQSGSTAKVPLAGAKFELRADANGQPGTALIRWYTSQETTAANLGTELTTAMGSGEQAGKAIATAYGLKPGTTFWIVETSAPAGYTIADPVKVVLSAEGNATFYTKNQATGQYEATSTLQLSQAQNSTFETEIVDSAVYSLPSAGGLGILEFLFLGAFIMTLVAGLARHTRREPARPRTAARPAPGRR